MATQTTRYTPTPVCENRQVNPLKSGGENYLSLKDEGVSPQLAESWGKLTTDVWHSEADDSGISECSADSEVDKISLWSGKDSLYSERSIDSKTRSPSTDMHTAMSQPLKEQSTKQVLQKPQATSRALLKQYGLNSQERLRNASSGKENCSDSIKSSHSSLHLQTNRGAIQHTIDTLIDIQSMFKSNNSSELYFPKRKQRCKVLRAANL